MKPVTSSRLACAAAALAFAALAGQAKAQTPRANGETVGIQNYAATTGNMHAIVAKEKGFCEKYNFKCEVKTINSTSLGLPEPIGAPSATDLRDIRIGVPEELTGEGIEPGVLKRFQETLDLARDLGATVEPTKLPHAPHALAAYYILAPADEEGVVGVEDERTTDLRPRLDREGDAHLARLGSGDSRPPLANQR